MTGETPRLKQEGKCSCGWNMLLRFITLSRPQGMSRGKCTQLNCYQIANIIVRPVWFAGNKITDFA